MVITVEISMYPLQENYRELIKSFIEKLNGYSDESFKVITTATSTMVVGEYQRVMEVMTKMLAWSHDEHGRAVFVTKFLPGYKPKTNS